MVRSSEATSSSSVPSQRQQQQQRQRQHQQHHQQRHRSQPPPMMAMSGFSMSPAAPSLLPPSPHPRPQRQSPAPASSSSASSSAASASATGTTPGHGRAASGLATRAASALGTQSSVRKDEAEEYDSATSDEDGALDDLDEADLLRSQPSAARNPSPHTPARRRRTRSPPRQPLSREVGSPRKEQGSSAKQPRRAREAPPSPHSKHPDQQLKKKKKHLAQHRPAEHKRPHRFQSDPQFAAALRRTHGWNVVPMKGDGACLFRAVAYHLYGDQEYHGDVREQCIEYMRRNRDHFASFVTGDFDAYLKRKAMPTTHGNHLEIQAMSELYNRTIEVYEYDSEPMNIFQSERSPSNPIRLSYHNHNHYNAIVDPRRHTFGVGLGLPGLETPKRVEDDVVEKIKHESLMAMTEEDMIAQAKRASLRDAYLHRPPAAGVASHALRMDKKKKTTKSKRRQQHHHDQHAHEHQPPHQQHQPPHQQHQPPHQQHQPPHQQHQPPYHSHPAFLAAASSSAPSSSSSSLAAHQLSSSAAKRGARMVPAHEADHEDDDDDGRTGDQRAGDHTVTDDEDMLLQIALAQSLQDK